MRDPRAKRWPALLLGLALGTSIFINYYRLGQGEFVGEDEALVMVKVARQFLWRVDIRNLGAILTSSHPPMRLLLPTPFAGLFGLSELWLRFPNALAGVLVCYWVYRLGRRAFSAPVGAIAATIVAPSGMSGVYRSANGIGIFTVFLLVALEYLLIFLDADSERSEGRSLIGVAVFLGLATLTFVEGIVFALPCAGTYWYKKRCAKRYVWPATLIYSALVGLYSVGWMVAPRLISSIGGYAVANSNAAHLWIRLQALGVFNLDDFVNRTVGTNSIWLCILYVCCIPWGVRRWGKKGWTMVCYFLPHLFAWMFVLDNPCGHATYEMPLWALLSAIGAWSLYSHVMRPQTLRALAVAMFVGMLLLAGWHTYVVFLQDRIAAVPANGIIFKEPGVAAGAPRFTRLGQAAAGVYIREHADEDTMILSNFGDSLELYYAGRKSSHPSLSDLLTAIGDPVRMRELDIRYLVLRARTIQEIVPSWRLVPACVVTVDQNPTLRIYDLWQETDVGETWPSEEYRHVFYDRYANPVDLRPFLVDDTGKQR